jgi:hypothetical protein
MRSRRWIQTLAGLAALSSWAPASASTFGRVGLDYLVAANELVVAGEVVEAHSY